MNRCPLCGAWPSDHDRADGGSTETDMAKSAADHQSFNQQMTGQQRKLTWEIIFIIILSVIITTLLINFIINNHITWAEYPVAVCLVIFSYVSLFAFWYQNMFLRLSGAFVISSLLLLFLDLFTDGMNWAHKIAVPILFIANFLAFALLQLFRSSTNKGINLIAYSFIAGGLLCIFIDGILSFYRDRQIRLSWSLIVGMCSLLVSIVLIFVHFRLRKGRNLEKTFHV